MADQFETTDADVIEFTEDAVRTEAQSILEFLQDALNSSYEQSAHYSFLSPYYYVNHPGSASIEDLRASFDAYGGTAIIPAYMESLPFDQRVAANRRELATRSIRTITIKEDHTSEDGYLEFCLKEDIEG